MGCGKIDFLYGGATSCFWGPWGHGLPPKELQAGVALLNLLFATCPKCHVSHICLLMLRVIMKWNQVLCTDSLTFPNGWEKLQISQLSNCLMKAAWPFITSNRIPYLQITSVFSLSCGTINILGVLLLLFLSVYITFFY